MGELVRLTPSVFWELRRAWATGRRVALSLDERNDRPRVEGHVTRVSATDAFCRVGSLTIPGDAILAVHWPSLLGDSTANPLRSLNGRPRRWRPQEEEIPGIDQGQVASTEQGEGG